MQQYQFSKSSVYPCYPDDSWFNFISCGSKSGQKKEVSNQRTDCIIANHSFMSLSCDCLIHLGRGELCWRIISGWGWHRLEAGGGTDQQLSGWWLSCCASCARWLRGVMASESQGAGEQFNYGVQARDTPQDQRQVWHRCCWGIKTLGSGRRWSHQICRGKHSWVTLLMSCPTAPTTSPARVQSSLRDAVSSTNSSPPSVYMEGKSWLGFVVIKTWLVGPWLPFGLTGLSCSSSRTRE